MPASLARIRRIARVRSLFGNIARSVGRSLEIPGPQAFEKAILANIPTEDSLPDGASLRARQEAVCAGGGCDQGWAYSNETDFPEALSRQRSTMKRNG